MKKILQLSGLIVLAIIVVCGTSLLMDKTTYSSWEINNKNNDEAGISWAAFEWVQGSLNGKTYDRLAMNIPCTVDGLENIVTFQFDLGANLTGVYEKTFNALSASNPELQHKVKRLRSRLQFWNKNRFFDNLNLHFGNYSATCKVAYLFKDFGEDIGFSGIADTIHLGTIGADLFSNKVLIIDYPNKQFAICDKMPAYYSDCLTDIELDKRGRVILPMKIHDRSYRIMFDNGSSIFPLITSANNMSNYSTSPDIDTIQISSWGNIHPVTGKLISDTFELAGRRYSHVKVYANHSGFGIDPATDGMTGNALFWNKTIVIDFRNRQFGLK